MKTTFHCMLRRSVELSKWVGQLFPRGKKKKKSSGEHDIHRGFAVIPSSPMQCENKLWHYSAYVSVTLSGTAASLVITFKIQGWEQFTPTPTYYHDGITHFTSTYFLCCASGSYCRTRYFIWVLFFFFTLLTEATGEWQEIEKREWIVTCSQGLNMGCCGRYCLCLNDLLYLLFIFI